MHIKAFFTAIILVNFLFLSAFSQSDSLERMTLPEIQRPMSPIKLQSGIDRDSLIEIYAEMLLHREQLNISPHDLAFYANLKEAAQQRQITRILHELMVKQPDIREMQAIEPMRSERQFAPYEGQIIRDINFSTTNVFSPSIDDPYHYSPGRLEMLGMFLHFNTNERILRNNLLFKPGDEIDPFIIADNERILRQLSYMEDARIYIFEDELEPGYVDIVIVTKDRISKGFDMDFSEIDEGRFEFYDKNIFGFGQELHANLLFNGGHENMFGYKAELNVNNIGGTFIRSGVSYLNAFENKIFHIRGERDFITPTMKYAGGIEFMTSDVNYEFYFPDTLYYDQKLNFNEYDYWFGRSFLLRGASGGANARRNFFVISRYNRQVFFERPEIAGNIRYELHNRNLYLLSMAYTRLNYHKSRYVYGFGPVEDIPEGFKFEATIGHEENQFFPRWYSGMTIARSNYLNNLAYMNNSISLGGFINKRNWEQGVFRLQSSGFSNLVEINRFFLRQFFSVNFTKGINRFDDEVINISNHNGIRGLRSDKLTGKQKLTLQMETMLFAKNHWYGFRYAYYAMADAGWIGPGNRFILKENLYSGLGIGMRVRNEHLVFPTLKFRFSWYPGMPDSASSRLFYIISESRNAFHEFKVTAPDILPYR